jgi:hypothetical protein
MRLPEACPAPIAQGETSPYLNPPHVAGDWITKRHSGAQGPVDPLNKLSCTSRSSAPESESSLFNINIPSMDFYKGNFAVFALLNAGLAFREYRQVGTRQEKDDGLGLEAEGKAVVLNKFKWNFIPIYLLVNGADWLQVRERFSEIARLNLTSAGTIHLPIVQRSDFFFLVPCRAPPWSKTKSLQLLHMYDID